MSWLLPSWGWTKDKILNYRQVNKYMTNKCSLYCMNIFWVGNKCVMKLNPYDSTYKCMYFQNCSHFLSKGSNKIHSLKKILIGNMAGGGFWALGATCFYIISDDDNKSITNNINWLPNRHVTFDFHHMWKLTHWVSLFW